MELMEECWLLAQRPKIGHEPFADELPENTHSALRRGMRDGYGYGNPWGKQRRDAGQRRRT